MKCPYCTIDFKGTLYFIFISCPLFTQLCVCLILRAKKNEQVQMVHDSFNRLFRYTS